jgi:predicted GIY-YIG superfamily endonuclease
MNCPWVVYVLQSKENDRFTYVGATVNVERRLRQHNGKLVGGAKYTRSHRPWSLRYIVSGFIDKIMCLQFEWRVKYESKRIRNCDTIQRRRRALQVVMNRKRISSRSTCDTPALTLICKSTA